MELKLYGSLRDVSVKPPDLERRGSVPLRELLQLLELPGGSVRIAMVNHRAVTLDSMVGATDRVALFPREYPFFADWNDLRLPEGG